MVERPAKRLLLPGRLGRWPRRRVRNIRFGGKGAGDFSSAKPDQCVAMRTQEAQVRIGTGELGLKSRLQFGRLYSSIPAFARAESEEQDLVILSAFQSERAPVDPIRQYVPQDFGDLELLMQPMRIGGHDIGNQLAKEALEIAHGLAGLVLGQVTGGCPEVSSKES